VKSKRWTAGTGKSSPVRATVKPCGASGHAHGAGDDELTVQPLPGRCELPAVLDVHTAWHDATEGTWRAGKRSGYSLVAMRQLAAVVVAPHVGEGCSKQAAGRRRRQQRRASACHTRRTGLGTAGSLLKSLYQASPVLTTTPSRTPGVTSPIQSEGCRTAGQGGECLPAAKYTWHGGGSHVAASHCSSCHSHSSRQCES